MSDAPRGYYRTEDLAVRPWRPTPDGDNAVMVLRWHHGSTRPMAMGEGDWVLSVEFWAGDLPHRLAFDNILEELAALGADPPWGEVMNMIESYGFTETEDYPA